MRILGIFSRKYIKMQPISKGMKLVRGGGEVIQRNHEKPKRE